jgi:transposase
VVIIHNGKYIPINQEWLYQKYAVEKLTPEKIAELIGVGHNTIWRRLNEYNIAIRSRSEAHMGKRCPFNRGHIITKAERKKRSLTWLKNKGAFEFLNDKEWLYQKYVNEDMTIRKIANGLEVDVHTVTRALREFDIPIKSRIEIIKSLTGEKCAQWKGGISFDPYCPKFNGEFRKRVRDFWGNKCVLCGKTKDDNGRALSVHHVNYSKEACCDDSPRLFVALCSSCHGKTGHNREYWKEYFTNLIMTEYDGECYIHKDGGE